VRKSRTPLPMRGLGYAKPEAFYARRWVEPWVNIMSVDE
jgi:hypothetical protein